MKPADASPEADSVASLDPFIFMYHHVGSMDRLGGFSPFVVSPAVFSAQLDAISARGLRVQTLAALLCAIDAGTIDSKSAVITFDDCGEALMEFALPELERRSWKASFFAVANKVGAYNDWDTAAGIPRVPLMGWDHLRELRKLGHEIGAHGFSHVSLRRCTRPEARSEMTAARETIEQGTGADVHTLAYPFGEAPDGYRGLCREAAYQGACSIFSMSKHTIGDRFAIRRILLTERDVGIRMRAKLSRVYLRSRAFWVDRRVLRQNATVPLP